MLDNSNHIANLRSKNKFPQLKLFINKRYEIKSKIGQGTIGEVFKAHDTVQGKDVAIKIAKPSQIFVEKIINEFKITSQFEHPNIISVFDFGIVRICEDENLMSRKFIVLEHCDTLNISNLLQKFEYEEKIKMIYQISHALHIIHKSGYIHRDLKLENILFDSKTGTVKITDLGLAIEYEKISPKETPVGTLLYMAPEVLQGKKYDQRADIYSLGILTYCMLIGSPPFESNDPTEILKWHLSQKELKVPQIPLELQNLLKSMLNPEPSRRPKNVNEIIKVLKTLNPNLPEIKNFKVRKPLGKDEEIKKAVYILNSIRSSTPIANITLIVGADGFGKTSLVRYINIEAKTLGFETIQINNIDTNKILNFLINSPFTFNLSPELRLKLERFKDETSLNFYLSIEFSQFLRELISNSAQNFPIAIFIDDIDPNEPINEIFLKSFLSPKEFPPKNVALFISCNDMSFYNSFLQDVEKIHLRSLSSNELKKYIQINFDFDEETIQKFAEILAEYTNGISAVVEIFSYYISNETESSVETFSKIARIKFDEILRKVEQLSPEQKKILDTLSLEEEPVEVKILTEFFCSNIAPHLNQLQRFSFIKIENDKVSIAYKALKEHIKSMLDETTKQKIHLNYAVIYLNQPNWETRADKILYHFTKAKDKDGVERLAEKGIENLILKNELKKAIKLCEDTLELLPEYLKPSFKIKLADLNVKTGNYQKVISILEDISEFKAFELKSEAYFRLGNTDKSIETLKIAFKISETVYDRIRSAIKISQIYASIGDVEVALQILKSFENKGITRFIEKTETIGDFYAGLGITTQMNGDEDKAKTYFELSLKHRLEKKNNFKIIAGYNNIANFLNITGHYDEAIKYWEKAIKISESIGDIIQSAHIYNNIGISYFKKGDYEKALKNYRKALAIYRTINDVPGIADVLGNTGELLIEEFKLEEALTSIVSAKELYKKLNNVDGICELNLILLSLYLNIGDLKNAELILAEIKRDTCHINEHLLRYYQAVFEMKRKNFENAESELSKLLELDVVRGDPKLYLKILICFIKLNYVTQKREELKWMDSIVNSIVSEIYDQRMRSIILFLTSLYYENKDEILAFNYLSRAADELGDDFSEFRWKIYLKMAQYYKSRGIEIKFLQYLEKALSSFKELIERIKNSEFVKSYVEDLETEKFFKLLQNLKV